MTPLAWLAGTLLGGIGIAAAAHAGGPDTPWWLWAPTALALLELFLVPSGAWTDTGRRGAVLVRLLAVAAIGTYWVSAVAAGSIGWGGSAPLAILMQWCVGLAMAARRACRQVSRLLTPTERIGASTTMFCVSSAASDQRPPFGIIAAARPTIQSTTAIAT